MGWIDKSRTKWTSTPSATEVVAAASKEGLVISPDSATKASRSSSASLTALGVQPAPPSWEDLRLRAKYTYFGDVLTIYDVFYSVLSTTRRLAPSGPTAPLRTDATNCGPARGQVAWEVPQAGMLGNQWLIKVLPFVGGDMLRRGRFMEAKYEIYVNTEVVGEWALFRR